ncbi:hypothetical protein HK100_010516 [Physocladia obscura]|uniref:Bacterial surface antigen (D15) domain-containing protein n=1 Tax=Physocladia obscura TaxID=109957 RepID=A0AAD5T3K8_9FUNG|nr:hypothetical protein HK100_010516 [Physocladia obscura]
MGMVLITYTLMPGESSEYIFIMPAGPGVGRPACEEAGLAALFLRLKPAAVKFAASALRYWNFSFKLNCTREMSNSVGGSTSNTNSTKHLANNSNAEDVATSGSAVRIGAVRFEGVGRTSHSLLKAKAATLLSLSTKLSDADYSLADASRQSSEKLPFASVALEAHATAIALRQLTVFESVDVVLDAPAPGVVDVVFHLVEKPALFASEQLAASATSADLSVSLIALNPSGVADSAAISIARSLESSTPLLQNGPFETQIISNVEAVYSRPWNFNPEKTVQFSAAKTNAGVDLYSSFIQDSTVLAAKFKTFDHVVGASHQFAYEASWRRLVDANPNASLTIKKDAGTSFKSSISYSTAIDTRINNSILSFKSIIEAAGLGGDIGHVKFTANSEAQHFLGHGFSVSASLKHGLLWTLGFGPSRVNDRFRISVRGFKKHGVGPKDGDDAIGGDLFAIGAVNLFTPLPLLRHDIPIKGHLFANGGNLVHIEDAKTRKSAAQRLFSSFSGAVGVGISLNFDWLQGEFNYCLPVSVAGGDRANPGFQFSLGCEFV